MIINSVGRNSKVVLELSVDEVNILNNVMFQSSKKENNPMFWELYAGIMIARDISQYGHLDSFIIDRISDAKNRAFELKKGNTDEQ